MSCPIFCHAFTDKLLYKRTLWMGFLSIWCSRAATGFHVSAGLSLVDVCAKIPPIIAAATPAPVMSHLFLFLFSAI